MLADFFHVGVGEILQADLVELDLLCQKHKMLAKFFMCACLAVLLGAGFLYIYIYMYMYVKSTKCSRNFSHGLTSL